jgi:uncharacterized protein DUF1554
MTNRRTWGVAGAIAVAVAVTACGGGSETRVHLAITGESPQMDDYQLAVGTRSALAKPEATLDVVIPDDLAGAEVDLQLWGLAAGQQIAYGSVSVTPNLHGTIDATVVLLPISCGQFCMDGAVECSGAGTITCSAGVDGCLAWSQVTPCPTAAPECTNGTCGTTCTDECSTGETRCDSPDTMQTCGQFDADPCLDWGPSTACGGGQTCAGSACATAPACAHDGDACDDGNACTSEDTCSGGVCAGTPLTCDTPPADTCESPTELLEYSATGTCSAGTGSGMCLYTPQLVTCTSAPPNGTPVCAAGACTFACKPGYMVSGTSCVPATNLIFVTTATYTGNLGGLAGADAKCQSVATAGGLTGTYKAWLSDSTTSAAMRMTHAANPYVVFDGTEISATWTTLTSSKFLTPIDESQVGGTVSSTPWTNTQADGTISVATTADDCDDWTTAASTSVGLVGNTTMEGKPWTAGNPPVGCNSALPLYCVEQ